MPRQKPSIADKPLPSNVHLAGEFFVAAELSKRGYSVALTMGNAKAVDLFAEREGRAVCVQVKASASQLPNWLLPRDPKKIDGEVLYILVTLNAIGQAPDFYILTSEEIRERGLFLKKLGGIRVSKVADCKDKWDVIEAALQKPGVTNSSRRLHRPNGRPMKQADQSTSSAA